MRWCKARRAGDALRRALPPLGAMFGGAALGRVDGLAREQRIAARGEVGGLGEREEGGEHIAAEMGLGEIEANAGFLDHQPRQPVRLGREQSPASVGRRQMRLRVGPGMVVGHGALS